MYQKIAIVCFNLSWQSGGPRLVFSLAQSLKKIGHRVIIYTPEFSGQYYQELWEGLDIKIVEPPSKLVWSGRSENIFSWIGRKIAQERLKKSIAKKIANEMNSDFDIVNIHDFAYTVGYFYKKRNPSAKILWTENDPPYTYLPKSNFVFDILSRVYNLYKDVASRKYFSVIDKVSVLDSYNEKWCKKRGLNPAVIRLGVDFEKFYQPVKDMKLNLFGLGSLNKYRHYEEIILAVKYLRDWGYNARAQIICNDMWNEHKYKSFLLKLVEENKLQDFIEFNFEGVSEDGLREVYQKNSFFVYPMYLPPPRDGFGFSIGVFEAMAAGLLLIVSRKTTSTEVLEDGKSALFVDPENPKQIAEKIKYIFDNPDLYKKIANAGQQLVKENLTWERYASNLLKITCEF